MTVTELAKICHEANRYLCYTIGDTSQLPWGDAAEWQRHSSVSGVEYSLANPLSTPRDQHEAWVTNKLTDGWTYGVFKDATMKTHPCIVHYDNLPEEQQAKDRLFLAIVNALRGLVTPV